jgi:hypothetical protein
MKKEKDLSIKTIAIDLLYQMINDQNVKQIMKELINSLLNCEKEII